ncbi:MAG: xanthine dehydrogenase small subunit [Pseudomonas sp.]
MGTGIRFLLDGEVVDLGEVDPTLTALEVLRGRLRRTGTKEGCAEGDCGACTIVLGELAETADASDHTAPSTVIPAKAGIQGRSCSRSDPPALADSHSAATATSMDLRFRGDDEGKTAHESLGPRLRGDDGVPAVQWRAVNACILFAPMLDGKAVLTVESLARHGTPHPVQRAMVDCHGSQCGFCTPGFVMSLYARSIGALGTGEANLADVIAGNLCRCTGYGPILEAGRAVAPDPASAEDVGAALAALAREDALAYTWTDPHTGQHRRAFAPRSVEALAACLREHPHAHIVAGATDVGLWVTKQLRTLETTVFIGGIAALRRIEEDADGLRIGAAVRYVEAHAALARLHPDLGELVRRIGALQVRNAGTLGGNIANGSPIGDTPPALIALGARLVLRRGDARRTLALEDFFIDYGKQDRQPGEFVEQVIVPRPAADARVHVRKLSKRFDSDISAVCGAACVELADGRVRGARIAFGGMAGTPKRARHAEAALVGRHWGEAAVEAAAQALAEDYAPLDDVRGSARYRLQAAANLLRGMWLREAHPEQPLDVLALEPAHG